MDLALKFLNILMENDGFFRFFYFNILKQVIIIFMGYELFHKSRKINVSATVLLTFYLNNNLFIGADNN